jgi:hypothetical protein
VRTLLTAPFVLLLLAAPAMGQGTAAEQLRNDPAVKQSQDPQPTEQGNRPPDSGYTDTKLGELTQLLTEIWAKPVDLQGNPSAGSGALSSPPPMPNDPAAPPAPN